MRARALCLVMAAAVGCGGGKDEATDKPAAAADDPDAPLRATLTPAELAPIVRELGPDGVAPTSIVVSFATPIVDRSEVGRVTSQSVLKLTPEVAGRLTYASDSSLRFTPARPFEFDTAYQVELQKVETRDGVLDAPNGDAAWRRSFRTPKFALLGWAPTEIDLLAHQVRMEVAFSGAVLPNLARGAMTFTIDGGAAPPARIELIPQRGVANAHRVTLQLTDPRIKVGSRLGLQLAPDLRALSGATAPGASLAYTVTDAPVVSIKAAKFAEGTSGYYLEVACDDGAAASGSRSYYDAGESYYGLSERCQLADDAVGKITFDPPVEHVYVAGGRAGFRVFGDFKRAAYRVRIERGARSVDGGTVGTAFGRSYVVPARKPQLAFASTGRYLPRKAWRNLAIKHLNVDQVNLLVRQVPPENLVFWLGNTSSDDADERTSNLVLKKTLALRGDRDVLTTTWHDVSAMLPATTKGVLELELAGPDIRATSRLLLTNLALVAKRTSVPDKPWLQTVHAWVLDVETQTLLDGVALELVRKSGKVVARCTTTGGGGCVLEVKPSSKDPDEAEPFALIARRGDDLTYLRYQDLQGDVPETSTSGAPYTAAAPYRAAVYSDRGVYRPGETAHVVAIVRTAVDRAPGQALPVDVKILDPRAKVVRKQVIKTNAAGVLAIDHALPAFADTGLWRVKLEVADEPLATYNLHVEEFVPERMAVTVAPRAPALLAGAPVAFDVSARYLFGGSAIDSGVELHCSVAPERFAPETNGELVYGVAPRGKPVNLAEVKQQLDPKGHVTVACGDAPGDTAFTQTARLTAVASVLEAGSGRATVRSATALLHPEKFYIGMKTRTPLVTSGTAFTVEGLIVDWRGRPLPAAVTALDLELGHLEADYGYGYDEDTGETSYRRHVRVVPEGKQHVPVVGGKFSFQVTPGDADVGYVVRAKAGKAVTDLVLDGAYAYDYYAGYGDDRADQTPRPAKPTQLKVELPAQTEIGAATTARVVAPYRGKLLWTVETDHVVTSQWMTTQGGEAKWTFTLRDFAPNVYVTAFLIKDPHLESRDAFLPDRAFGVASTRVTPKHAIQRVTIDVPSEVRSGSPLQVKLDLGPTTEPTFATVAVVDEGILSLTNFATPDPTAQLFAKRALAVDTYETIGWTMLYQPAGPSSRHGGGDEEDAAGGEGAGGKGGDRVSPVKPVALFSGVVKVPADGKLTVPFQLPTYRGKLRVMAITASASKIGRVEAKVTVRDPLVLQVTFPRFVADRDELQIPVFLTNLSGKRLDVAVKLDARELALPGVTMGKRAAPPLTFSGKDAGTIALDDGHADTLVFQARVALPTGAIRLHVTARAGALVVEDEVEVPVLPAGPRERVVQKLRVAPGKLDLAAAASALRNWAPGSETSTFWLTANPYGEVFQHLGYLIHYPYGCIEQTTSATRPLLYAAALAEQVDPELAALRIEDMVIAGIDRVFSMQTPAGGFGYWPGATEPEDWSTAYATHMLLDAKQAGYAVPEDRLREVLAWIERRAAQYERGLGAYARRGWGHYDGQVQAYFDYVLARAGRAKKGRILGLLSRLPAKPTAAQAEDRYLLMAALYLAGDRRYARELKSVDASPISPERVNSWSFYSDRRRRGLMLSTFVDLFGHDPAGEPLADRVAQALGGLPSYGYTTQELVWGTTGLGKWVGGKPAAAAAAGTLTADGDVIAPRRGKHASKDLTWTLRRASERRQLALDVPASAAGLWLVIRSEGVRPGGSYKTGGNGLSVTRTYRTLDGTEVDPAAGEVKLGDLLYVELELANTTGTSIQNIALVDRLPAGFEIENPRLGRTVKLDWVDDDALWTVDFQNLRDDRVEAFGALAAGARRKVVYTVRAVTSGKFALPPVEAEAMYDPTLWARGAGGTAVVGGPWTGKTL